MVGCHRQAAGTARDDTGLPAGVSAFGSNHPAKVALAKQVVHLQEKKMLVEQSAGIAAREVLRDLRKPNTVPEGWLDD